MNHLLIILIMANVLVTTANESSKKLDLMKDLDEKHKSFAFHQNQRLVTDNFEAVNWFCGKITSMLKNSVCRAAYVKLYAETGKMDCVPNECQTGELLDGPSEKTFSYDWQHVKRTIERQLPGVTMYSGSIYADGPSFEISPKGFTFSNDELQAARNEWVKNDEIAQIQAIETIIPKLDNMVEKLDPVLCAEAHKKWYVEHGYFTDALCDCMTDYVESPRKNLSDRRLFTAWKKEGFGMQKFDGRFRVFMTQNEAFKHI